MKLEPLFGRLFVSRDPQIDRTKGGILLPEKSAQQACTGLCLVHTPGDYWDWIGEPCLTGQRVVFEKWAGRRAKIQGMVFWIIPETSVLGVEEKANGKA